MGVVELFLLELFDAGKLWLSNNLPRGRNHEAVGATSGEDVMLLHAKEMKCRVVSPPGLRLLTVLRDELRQESLPDLNVVA
jgi:hypothetical protein